MFFLISRRESGAHPGCRKEASIKRKGVRRGGKSSEGRGYLYFRRGEDGSSPSGGSSLSGAETKAPTSAGSALGVGTSRTASIAEKPCGAPASRCGDRETVSTSIRTSTVLTQSCCVGTGD